MSKAATETGEVPPKKAPGLPPRFGPIENGKRTWIRVGEVDYGLMGYAAVHSLLATRSG